MKKFLYAIISLVLCIATMTSILACTPQTKSSSIKGDQSESESASENVAPESEPENDTQADSEEEVESEMNVDTEEEETESLVETETETETETEPETETESETEKQTEKETEKETVKEDPIPGKTKTTETLKAKSYTLAAKSSMFRYVGRVKPVTGGLLFDHSASTLEFQGYMTGKVDITISSTKGKSYFTVYIDGKRSSERIEVSGEKKVVTIAKFSGKYFHKISIVKQTEIDWSTSTLHSLSITGYLTKAPENKDLYIEFYGDSLTAGYGNIGNPGDEPSGSAPFEDATKTYAYLLSQKLDADCSILARSGVGLAPCWSECFQDRFKKYSYARSGDLFSFTGARVPDLVVIHLGANDYTHARNEDGTPTKNEFISHGKDLVNFIQKGYKKDMPIIWAYDPDEGRPEWIKEILKSFGGEAAGFYIVALDWDEAGAGGHPSANEHQKHANIIYNLIKEKKILG